MLGNMWKGFSLGHLHGGVCRDTIMIFTKLEAFLDSLNTWIGAKRPAQLTKWYCLAKLYNFSVHHFAGLDDSISPTTNELEGSFTLILYLDLKAPSVGDSDAEGEGVRLEEECAVTLGDVLWLGDDVGDLDKDGCS